MSYKRDAKYLFLSYGSFCHQCGQNWVRPVSSRPAESTVNTTRFYMLCKTLDIPVPNNWRNTMNKQLPFCDLTCRLSSSILPGAFSLCLTGCLSTATMAQRLRENARKINWTPEPIRPELLHFFDLPSISSISQNYKNFNFPPSSVHSEVIPSSLERMPIRTPQPPLEKKISHEMVLTYHRSRKAPICKHGDPSPSSGARNLASQMVSEKGNWNWIWKKGGWKGKMAILPSQIPAQGNDLKFPRGDLDPSVTEIGSPPTLSLSQKGARRKRSVPLLFPYNIPKHAKRRRLPHNRTTQIGWINTGGIIPWPMPGSHVPYNLRRRKHINEADAPMAFFAGSFKSTPPAQLGNGKRKLSVSVSLLSDEIEEDFMKMTGEMPLQQPNKRLKKTQSQLDVTILHILRNNKF